MVRCKEILELEHSGFVIMHYHAPGRIFKTNADLKKIIQWPCVSENGCTETRSEPPTCLPSALAVHVEDGTSVIYCHLQGCVL